MEFEMENKNSKRGQSYRISNSSINSNPELRDNKVNYLRISLLLINISSAISGFYIFQNSQYYLSSEYNFEYFNSLYIFLIIYSLGMVGSLIFSFLFSLLIKIILFVIKLCAMSDSKHLTKNEQNQSENSFGYINANSNEFAMIPYILTMFIVSTAAIYLISLPYSIFLLIFLNKNQNYSYLNNFSMLYFFIIINGIAGLILFFILLVIVFVKRKGSFRNRNYYIDDENLNNLRNEIKGAMDKADK